MRNGFRKVARKNDHSVMVSAAARNWKIWGYTGYQFKRRLSFGTSIGTRGKEFHARNKGRNLDIKVRYNLDTHMPYLKIQKTRKYYRRRK